MLDSKLRPLIDPYLFQTARFFQKRGFSAGQITMIGFCLSALTIITLWMGSFFWGLLFIIGNRALDGVKRTLSRLTQPDVIDNNEKTYQENSFDRFFGIITDSFFYAGVPLGFALYHPAANGAGASFLLFALLLSGVSFLAATAVTAQDNTKTDSLGKTLFYSLGGLMEKSETLFFFMLMCLFPMFFDSLAVFLGVLYCFGVTMRIFAARIMLR